MVPQNRYKPSMDLWEATIPRKENHIGKDRQIDIPIYNFDMLKGRKLNVKTKK